MAGDLTITSVFGDVTASDQPQLLAALSYNQSSIVGKSPFTGTPGQTFTVQVSLTFQACPCVHQVTAMASQTPGFAVVGTTPSLPVSFAGQGGDYYTTGFTVLVSAPPTPYNGTLTLVATIGS